jgi:hypothetical protein
MMDARNDMKEVFTKSFWEGVKNTFDDALEGKTPTESASQVPVEDKLEESSGSEIPPPPPVSSEQE